METALEARKTPWTAISLGVIGLAHTALTVKEYREEISEIVRDGVIDQVDKPSALGRGEAFWFANSGISLLALAAVTAPAERSPAGPPRILAPALVGLATWGVALMPRSGFWSLYAAAALAHRSRRR